MCKSEACLCLLPALLYFWSDRYLADIPEPKLPIYQVSILRSSRSSLRRAWKTQICWLVSFAAPIMLLIMNREWTVGIGTFPGLVASFLWHVMLSADAIRCFPKKEIESQNLTIANENPWILWQVRHNYIGQSCQPTDRSARRSSYFAKPLSDARLGWHMGLPTRVVLSVFTGQYKFNGIELPSAPWNVGDLWSCRSRRRS